MVQVTVLGGGIIGLSTAIVLVDAGYDVELLADRHGEDATSGAAGAVWYPYQVGKQPDPRTFPWARETYGELERLARESGSGVVGTLPMYLFAGGFPDSTLASIPDWAVAFPDPDRDLKPLPTRDLPPPLPRHAELLAPDLVTEGAWRFDAPVVHPSRHLEWLRAKLGARVRKIPAPIDDLDTLDGDFVVNCTGRRARSLAKDEFLKPALGQVVVTEEPQFRLDFVFADDRIAETLIYLIPRGVETVLGGCSLAPQAEDGAVPWTSAEGPAADPQRTETILAGFERLGFSRPTRYRAVAEWRPVHERRVIVERRGRVIHNYGHGGAGFTLAYGCAREVLRELENA
jgi:D-amino-acid oxidase